MPIANMANTLRSLAGRFGTLLVLATLPVPAAHPGAADSREPVSFYKQIRPIFQANCQGCHQPAKARGGYVMTEVEKVLAAGDSGDRAVIPNQPDQSPLVKLITPVNGEAEMPQGKPPLVEHEIALIRRWIAEGANDDTPANAKQRYDMDHPPVYTRLPVVTSMDYSPDGELLAVAGFHEVLLHKADGSGLVARLVGLSERIEKVAFSPDGKWLAVAGGLPARMGEVQIWDVAKPSLRVSVPVGYDTVYGVSWSPDGNLVAFGCADNTVRAIEAATGKQVLQQGSHNDWVLDTVFNTNGTHLISVGRDMSTKLTEVETQRFVDNVTSITPGALRGGLEAIARHPDRDEIVVGGSDGVPQIYQVFRTTARKIGDNANLLRKFPAMAGRIFSVDYSPDGRRIAAGASLDNHGAINLYSAEFDSRIPTNVLAAYRKTVAQQTPAEKEAIEQYVTSEVKLLATVPVEHAGVYAVRFSPDGRTVAASGQDGMIRLIDAGTGAVRKQFAAAPVTQVKPQPIARAASGKAAATPKTDPAKRESLPKGARVASLEVLPAQVRLTTRNESVQFVVLARLQDGDTMDVTRLAKFVVPPRLAEISPSGLLTPKANGAEPLKITFGGQSVAVPLEIKGLRAGYDADFIRNVNPVLTRLGCNQGTCHGSKEGKVGFKLSLRGYDPLFDVRAFTDDLASRRVNIASPDDSLMLLKATGAVPHEGGQRTTTDSKYYAILRQWIAGGAKLDLDSPRVARLEVFPKDPVVQQIGAKQQMRVVATYGDGRQRDVTAEAFIESGNTDVATTDGGGLIETLRRGEAPVLARYEGAYAATTVTVMGDRTGFVWQPPPANNRIDELVAAKWQRMKILPSDLCDDYEFIRRVHLDLTGLPPSAEAVRQFVADPRETRVKRDALIDRLVGSEEYVDHWANKWADLLQVNRKFLGEEGARLFRDWIRAEVEANTPYDQFVKKILTASGSNRENPAASYYKVLRNPLDTMENTTHLFLATRFNCNKCHDHPFERWTQDQYYHMAAFFAQVDLKRDPQSGNRTIGGTAVEGAKPLFEIVADMGEGEVKHDRTGQVTSPDFPYPAKFAVPETGKASRRDQLAAWLTSEDNRYFAMSYVNRIWGYLLGVGIIEPLDDIRAGNPPTNPELLDFLTREFIRSGFNVQELMKLIAKSRTYQLALVTHQWNEDDKINYSHALARRLPAEVLLDAVYKVTGSTPNFPGVKPGTRAAALPDSAVDLPSGFLASLGRPPRESACECERSNDIRLGSVMALLSGPAVSGAVNDPKNEIARLVATEPDDRKLVSELFLRILNRPATDSEIRTVLDTFGAIEPEHRKLAADLDAKESWWAGEFVRLEKQRAADLALAKTALADYEQEIAPAVAKAEQDRAGRIAKAEKALKDYEPKLVAGLLEWEKGLTPARLGTRWTPLKITEARATGNVTRLAIQKDGSVLAQGQPNDLPDYTITAEASLANITGVLLEVLPDDSLPKFGPGRKDGNFVLTEFRLSTAADAAKRRPGAAAAAAGEVKFKAARASHNQRDYDVKETFDGVIEAGQRNGWAIGGKVSEPQWAAFQLARPIGSTNGQTLTFTMIQKYREGFSLGRFRLWVTTDAQPLEQGLPADIADIIQTPAGDRTEAQAGQLLDYYRTQDPELRKRQQALFTANLPLPVDPKLVKLQAAVAKLSETTKTDPALVQLREDVKLSEKQAANQRLTGAQDLAWALINNPAFLFNR